MNFRPLVIALVSFALMQGGFTHSAAEAASQPAGKSSKASKTGVKKAKAPVKKASAKKASAKKAAKAAPKASVKKVALKRNPGPAVRGDDHDAAVVDQLGHPLLRSAAFYVANQNTGAVILERKSDAVLPIASITKLMTAMVVLDAGLSLAEELTISTEDIDLLKGTGSRVAIGTRMTREEMLNLALMSSENRAASALGRHYPGGLPGFIDAMNIKARMLGLMDTRFADSTGLNPANVSSPRDLARMVSAAATYPLIREFSTTSERHVKVNGHMMRFANTNGLVRTPGWEIAVSKTGYIREAGRCLVMQTYMHDQPVIIVLMDSDGRYTRTADAVRIKNWLESSGGQQRMAILPGQKES